MSINEITTRIRSAKDAKTLDEAVLAAGDFVECGEGEKDELSMLFQAIIEQFENLGDREEALNCLSNCAIALGSVRENDMSKLVSLVDGFDAGEKLAFINILANSDRVEYLETLQLLAGDENEEISVEAQSAMEELATRTK